MCHIKKKKNIIKNMVDGTARDLCYYIHSVSYFIIKSYTKMVVIYPLVLKRRLSYYGCYVFFKTGCWNMCDAMILCFNLYIVTFIHVPVVVVFSQVYDFLFCSMKFTIFFFFLACLRNCGKISMAVTIFT